MENNYNNYKELGLFNNGDYLVFSFKKTEKIVSAIYLISSLIKDNEPMKWELREGGMALLSVLMTLNGTEAMDKNRLLQTFFSSAVQLISYLNISRISSLISDMNAKIIIDEITLLVDYLKQQTVSSVHSAGFILSDSFFATDKPQETPKRQMFTNTPKKLDNDKDTRKNSILSLLKKDSHLTIKDFVKVIKDCSEKTIQRELIDLVKKGLVKKEGERRWSTYSLV